MKPVSLHRCIRTKSFRPAFALMSSLILMVLIVLIAVGMLSLSSLTLSGTNRDAQMAEARAAARLALMMAISQLQSELGPDQRITITADQLPDGADGAATAAADGHRHWTGVYRAWNAADADRPAEPEFMTWLTSGRHSVAADLNTAKSPPSANAILLVGSGTAGLDASHHVQVPATRITDARGGKPRIAWWTADQNAKATLTTPTSSTPDSLSAIRDRTQVITSSELELLAASQGSSPFSGIDPNLATPAKVLSIRQADLLVANRDETLPHFHDVAPATAGLLTNVRNGGFRRDLSLQLQAFANNPSQGIDTPLYSVSDRGVAAAGRDRNQAYGYGINLGELAAYASLPDQLQRAGRGGFTSGGALGRGVPHLQLPSAAAGPSDPFFFFKMPTVLNYQMLFSLQSFRDSTNQQVVNLVSDPIITLWNPFDVPLVIPNDAFLSIKYFQIPYDIIVNGTVYPLLSTVSGSSSGDHNYYTFIIGRNGPPIIMKPGEVLKFSQTAGTVPRSGRDVEGSVGFNFGGGIRTPLRTREGQTLVVPANSSIDYELRPNNLTAGKTSTSGNSLDGNNRHTRHFSMTHHEVYVGNDRGSNSLGVGNIAIDWDWGARRLTSGRTRAMNDVAQGPERKTNRLYADRFADVFPRIPGRRIPGTQLSAAKNPIFVFGFHAKTEMDANGASRTLARFNPKAHHQDFYDLSPAEREMLPYEISIQNVASFRDRFLGVDHAGRGYFGGGMDSEHGSSYVVTHSIPREPPLSLAALQHSLANGFLHTAPTHGYASLNAREPLLPQISHAIGNSLAPSVMAPNQIASLINGRPAADHSYLSNRELWDQWFLSGLANRNDRNNTYGVNERLDLRAGLVETLQGREGRPNPRYLGVASADEASQLASRMIRGSGANVVPNRAGIDGLAAHLIVDGMFNVNTTSIPAWKAVLGALRGNESIIRDIGGNESIRANADGVTPVINASAPMDLVAPGTGNVSPNDPAQWAGRRVLDDAEIDRLARAIVRQVRMRGPFLSLSDFVNRRPGGNVELALSGAVQSAIDDPASGINQAYEGRRSVSTRFTRFPAAEEGIQSYGAPGVVKQADILTPIAPILSVRGDTFLIRAYGESVDASGKVLARAWCEATIVRSHDYVDTADAADTVISNPSTLAPLNATNARFGRRMMIQSFRWLKAEEI